MSTTIIRFPCATLKTRMISAKVFPILLKNIHLWVQYKGTKYKGLSS
jgi:hypothetical protein